MTVAMTWLKERIFSQVYTRSFFPSSTCLLRKKSTVSPTWLFLPLHLSYSFSCPSRVPLLNSCVKIVNLLYLCFFCGGLLQSMMQFQFIQF